MNGSRELTRIRALVARAVGVASVDGTRVRAARLADEALEAASSGRFGRSAVEDLLLCAEMFARQALDGAQCPGLAGSTRACRAGGLLAPGT